MPLSNRMEQAAQEAAQKVVMTTTRIDVVAYDEGEHELDRKEYSVIPGDQIFWDRDVPGIVRLDAIAYDAEGIELYRSEFLAHQGYQFTYKVPTGDDVRFV